MPCPREEGWQFEPKWDGFRCLVFRDGQRGRAAVQVGKPLGRYFPDVVVPSARCQRTLRARRRADPGGDGALVRSAAAAPAPGGDPHSQAGRGDAGRFILFDCLVDAGDALLEPLAERRAALGRLLSARRERISGCRRSPDRARRALADEARGALDGVVAKRLDGPTPGERAMLKVKRCAPPTAWSAASATRPQQQVGSLLLGLYDEGLLNHVGFTSAIPAARSAALTQRLERWSRRPASPATRRAARAAGARSADRMAAAEAGTRGRGALRPGHRRPLPARHRFLRWRPDKAPQQCTYDQLAREAPPAKLVTEVIAR